MLEEAGELPLLKELPAIVLRRSTFTHPSIASDYTYSNVQRGNLAPHLGMPQVLNITGFHVMRQRPKAWKPHSKLNARDGTLFCNTLEDDPILMRLESSSSNSIMRKDCRSMQRLHGNRKSNISLDCPSPSSVVVASSLAAAQASIRYDKNKEKKKKKKQRMLKLVRKQSVGHDHDEGLNSTSTSPSQTSTLLDEKDDVVLPKNHHHHLCHLHDGPSHRLDNECDVYELPKSNVLTQFGSILPNCYWLKINQRRRRRRRRRNFSLPDIMSPTTTTAMANPTSPMLEMQRFSYANSPASTYIKYCSPRLVKSSSCTPRDGHGKDNGDLQIESLPLLSDPSVIVGTSDVDGLCDSCTDDKIYMDRLKCEIVQNDESSFSQGPADSGDVGLKDKFVSHGDKQNNNINKHVHIVGNASERCRSLSQKYRPNSLEDLVGQKSVSHTLSNAILRKKEVHPAYLFHGPGGTGKTTAARIFALALNCIGTVEKEKEQEQDQIQDQKQRPCHVCQQCKFSQENVDVIREIDAASHNGLEHVKALLQRVSQSSSLSSSSSSSMTLFNVFIIDECHVLPSYVWNSLLKILEKPPKNLVFILITSAPIENIPSNVLSICQNLVFPKIEESDITERLRALSHSENLDVEPGALEHVASRADGSLREAEMILDQLSLLGPKITVSMVHELFGSISDEKLMGLLDLAMSSDTTNTILKAREFINSGMEPLDLVVKLMSLIEHVIEGSSTSKQPMMMLKTQHGGRFFSRNSPLREEELHRLRAALNILSGAEKQLRSTCNDRMTWLTAALIQIAPSRPSIASSSGITDSLRNYPHSKARKAIRRKGSVETNYKPLHIPKTMRNKMKSNKPNFELRYWLAHAEESSEFIHVKESLLSSSDALKVVSSHHFSSSSSILRCQQERHYIEVGSLHYWRSGRSEQIEYSSGTRREHDAYSTHQSFSGMPSTPESQNLESLEIISDSDRQYCSEDFRSSDVDARYYHSSETEEEYPRFKSRSSKCGGLLCWMEPKVERRN